MKLKNLTERFVKDFADSVIYQRGHVYYKDGMVSELEYDCTGSATLVTPPSFYDIFFNGKKNNPKGGIRLKQK